MNVLTSDRRLSVRAQVVALVVIALVVRVAFVALLPHPINVEGSDAWWYMYFGKALVRAAEPHPTPAAPVYILFVGAVASLFPEPAVIPLIQLIQAILGALTVGLVYLLGRGVWSHGVGLIAGAVVAVSPAFVVETANVLSETLFIFLLMAALVFYVWRGGDGRARTLAALGVILGVATLTRAALLAFPAAIVLHLVMAHGWRRALRPAAALLLAFALTLAPWTVYNLIRWDRLVIGAEGFASFLWLGAQEAGWRGPEATDAAVGVTADDPLKDPNYAGQAVASIASDPAGYAALRLRNWAEAIIQPHNTVYYPGESLKSASARWLAEDRSLGGLVALTQLESFWPKLALYVFHFSGLAAGLAGMVIAARRPNGFRAAFVLYAVVGYFLSVHLVLYALPRYLFPTEAVWWLFAALALATAWEWLRAREAHRPARTPRLSH